MQKKGMDFLKNLGVSLELEEDDKEAKEEEILCCKCNQPIEPDCNYLTYSQVHPNNVSL